MSEKIRIVYFITSLESGGTERQLALLLEGLDHNKFEKHIVCLSGLGPLKDNFKPHVDSITDLKYPRVRHQGKIIWKNIPFIGVSMFRLYRTLRRLKPDILHTLIPVCNVMGALTGKLARVPIIVCSRLSLGNYRDTNQFFAFMENVTDRFFTLIHCKSESIRDDVIQREPVDPDILRVIYNGLKTDAFGRPYDKGPLREELELDIARPVVGMVANLKPYKGHSDVIKAIPKILESKPDTLFLFVGRDDGIQTELESLAASLGVLDSIRFAGERQDVPKLLQLMTLLISASHEEGFSNTILEAMASGLPVVATRVGGNLEQVADGITGVLVDPHKSADIAAAVLQLLENPDQAQKMGRHGNFRVARNFSHQAITEQMTRFYMDAIEMADE